jgi:protein-S-isoprenylcysteine O-methyltransferase Ste14
MVLATLAFALLHSLLASRTAKDAAAKVAGERQRNGLYRMFYLAQSVVSLAGLLLYARRLPDRVLYEVRGPWARLMNVGQLAGLGLATAAAAQIGVTRMLGLASVAAWLRKAPVVPPEPEAQGPAPDGHDHMRATGPFAWSRHPLNFAPLPVFWLMPRMTAKLLAFNIVATAYLILGSLHEEARLRSAYGQKYAAYEESGVPFYVPGML